MSRAMLCDHCGDTLVVNDRGEAAGGEEAAWLKITTTWMRADLCSRSCAVEMIQSPEFIARHDAELEVIASIATPIEREAADG